MRLPESAALPWRVVRGGGRNLSSAAQGVGPRPPSGLGPGSAKPAEEFPAGDQLHAPSMEAARQGKCNKKILFYIKFTNMEIWGEELVISVNKKYNHWYTDAEPAIKYHGGPE